MQSAIASVHNEAATWESTDWPQIAALYGVLAGIDPSPVVTLNRAVAIGFADGFEAGLLALDEVSPAHLPQPHLLAAARAEMLLRSGRPSESIPEFDRALALTSNRAEIHNLQGRKAAAQAATAA